MKAVVTVALLLGAYIAASCAADSEERLKADARLTFRKLVEEERILHGLSGGPIIGTGGPTVSLPSGKKVTRDRLMRAIEPALENGAERTDELIEALASPHEHVRYAAYLALSRITGQTASLRYLAPAGSEENRQGIERWKVAVNGYRAQRKKAETDTPR